ncbi:MAG: signal recognition particle receptor subunit alpha [Bradymonadaceae bacterium]
MPSCVEIRAVAHRFDLCGSSRKSSPESFGLTQGLRHMAMFDVVAKGFRDVRNRFEGKREITEENIEEALKDIRMSMLEADVNFRIAKEFIGRVKEKALGEVVKVKAKGSDGAMEVSPGDHFIKICHDELEGLMGPVDTTIVFANERIGPTKIMMVGLQGSGKTTTTAKLAKLLIDQHGKKPLLVGADVYRPAAIEQLRVLGKQLDIPVHAQEGGDPVAVCKEAVELAKRFSTDDSGRFVNGVLAAISRDLPSRTDS